jgi:hypothetical protein
VLLPRLPELSGNGTCHLRAILVPEWRRVAPEQRTVNADRQHQLQLLWPASSMRRIELYNVPGRSWTLPSVRAATSCMMEYP